MLVLPRRNALPFLIRTSEPSLLHIALRNGAHLAVLSGFALAQPLLDILSRNPEFFAIRRSSSTQIVLFALFVVFVPPAALLLAELAVAAANRAAARLLHLVFVAGLAAALLRPAPTRGRLDAERYPNFAALARTSTWYRSATTVEWLTEVATPAILTGIRPPPHKKLLPIYADHPNNIFTLLGRSYRVRAVESLTHMCP